VATCVLLQFNRILITALRAFVNRYHTDWEECLPAILYSYHNTVHSSTGYTPHQLLFGWTPTDMRAPFAAVASKLTTDCSKVARWLTDRVEDLKKAQISLEYARAAMGRAHKTGVMSHEHKTGDQVKVTTEHLAVRATRTRAAKLMLRYVCPFTIAEQVNTGAIG
jgi:hypothetical protein